MLGPVFAARFKCRGDIVAALAVISMLFSVLVDVDLELLETVTKTRLDPRATVGDANCNSHPCTTSHVTHYEWRKERGTATRGRWWARRYSPDLLGGSSSHFICGHHHNMPKYLRLCQSDEWWCVSLPPLQERTTV